MVERGLVVYPDPKIRGLRHIGLNSLFGVTKLCIQDVSVIRILTPRESIMPFFRASYEPKGDENEEEANCLACVRHLGAMVFHQLISLENQVLSVHENIMENRNTQKEE